ncbi:MAG: hypothetical protein H6923_11150 [Alphaproteobacteria bacterium]|nr:hypothetical protein [Alphaproteobacteria bacterium]
MPRLGTGLLPLALGGCGAPSFDFFGAYFPAWMLCALAGIASALVARAAFVATGAAKRLPFQLFLCTAIGVIVAIVVWLLLFGI